MDDRSRPKNENLAAREKKKHDVPPRCTRLGSSDPPGFPTRPTRRMPCSLEPGVAKSRSSGGTRTHATRGARRAQACSDFIFACSAFLTDESEASSKPSCFSMIPSPARRLEVSPIRTRLGVRCPHSRPPHVLSCPVCGAVKGNGRSPELWRARGGGPKTMVTPLMLPMLRCVIPTRQPLQKIRKPAPTA